jgi:hypothetical protein
MKFRAVIGLTMLVGQVAAGQPYKFVQEIPIGGESGWDILNIDAVARLLYLSHITEVVVVDIEKNRVAGDVDTDAPHLFADGAIGACAQSFTGRNTARGTHCPEDDELLVYGPDTAVK